MTPLKDSIRKGKVLELHISNASVSISGHVHKGARTRERIEVMSMIYLVLVKKTMLEKVCMVWRR